MPNEQKVQQGSEITMEDIKEAFGTDRLELILRDKIIRQQQKQIETLQQEILRLQAEINS